jgi:hypothetical protein
MERIDEEQLKKEDRKIRKSERKTKRKQHKQEKREIRRAQTILEEKPPANYKPYVENEPVKSDLFSMKNLLKHLPKSS